MCREAAGAQMVYEPGDQCLCLRVSAFSIHVSARVSSGVWKTADLGVEGTERGRFKVLWGRWQSS